MKIKTYSNNLRLVVNTKKNVDVVSFNIFVNVGAKNEGENEHGYAHFLEHMFFKSTKQTSYKDILKRLDDLGVSNNAYTTMKTETAITTINNTVYKINDVLVTLKCSCK